VQRSRASGKKEREMFNPNDRFYDAVDRFRSNVTKYYPKGSLEMAIGRRLQLDGQGLSIILLNESEDPKWGLGTGMVSRGPVVTVQADVEAMYDEVDAQCYVF
jgi:hypothetical protein